MIPGLDNKYQRTELLGAGGFAEVYRADRPIRPGELARC